MATKPMSNIRAERARIGLSAQQLADQVGVSPFTVSRWENGQSEPSGKNLVQLCAAFGCSADYLLGLTDSPRGDS